MYFQEISSAFTLLNMHIEILNSNQQQLLPFIKKYKEGYYLVGGTAIALHIGHRQSVDFDLFTKKKINFTSVKKAVAVAGFSSNIIVALSDQIHFIINDVKLTFFEFPFLVEARKLFKDAGLNQPRRNESLCIKRKGKMERLCGSIFFD